jgi:hypothetical protein
VGIAVLLGLYLLVRATNSWVLIDWPGLYCLLVLGAAVAHLSGRAPVPGRGLRTPSWSMALVVLGVGALGMRVLSLPDYARATTGGQRSALLVLGVAEALAVLAVSRPLARRAAVALRRLSPVTASASPPSS